MVLRIVFSYSLHDHSAAVSVEFDADESMGVSVEFVGADVDDSTISTEFVDANKVNGFSVEFVDASVDDSAGVSVEFVDAVSVELLAVCDIASAILLTGALSVELLLAVDAALAIGSGAGILPVAISAYRVMKSFTKSI
jgi:hypothetical protein